MLTRAGLGQIMDNAEARGNGEKQLHGRRAVAGFGFGRLRRDATPTRTRQPLPRPAAGAQWTVKREG